MKSHQSARTTRGGEAWGLMMNSICIRLLSVAVMKYLRQASFTNKGGLANSKFGKCKGPELASDWLW